MGYFPVLLRGAENRIDRGHDCLDKSRQENIDAINLKNGRDLLQTLRSSARARVGFKELDEILRTIKRSAN